MALFLKVGLAAGAVALATGSDDVDALISALNAKYRAMPSPSTVEEALQRNWDYEREFAAIGGEAPNGNDQLTPADFEPHVLPEGIQPATEDVPGFRVLNMWSGEVEGEYVVVASATPESAPGQGGVIVFDSQGQSPFIAAPSGVIGALTIASVSGTRLELANPNGIRVAFDAALRAFVQGSRRGRRHVDALRAYQDYRVLLVAHPRSCSAFKNGSSSTIPPSGSTRGRRIWRSQKGTETSDHPVSQGVRRIGPLSPGRFRPCSSAARQARRRADERLRVNVPAAR